MIITEIYLEINYRDIFFKYTSSNLYNLLPVQWLQGSFPGSRTAGAQT